MMKKCFYRVFLILNLLMMIGIACWPQEKTDSKVIEGGRIRINQGESKIFDNVENYDVTNTDVVSAEAAPDGKIILRGLKEGQTTLLLKKSGALGILSYNVEVIGINTEQIYAKVQGALGAIVGLNIKKEGEIITLTGDIHERDDGKRIDIQKEKYGNSILDLTNRTYMIKNLERLQEEFKKSRYTNLQTGTQVGEDGQEVLVMRGTVFSDKQKEDILQMAKKFFDEKRIVENIEVEKPQVEVDVDIYTIDVNKMHQLGSNDLFKQIASFSGTPWTFVTGPRNIIGPGPHTRAYPVFSVPADDFKSSINALNQNGSIINTSHQHVSVRSGEEGTIQNVTDQIYKIEGAYDAKLEKVTIGQTLEITPIVLDSGSFETKVKAILSEPTDVVNTNEDAVIAVARRELDTTFVSRKDETVVVGGGKRNIVVEKVERTPVLGHIPILNLFFKEKKKSLTEAVNIYFMTLRSPMITEAEGEALSNEATEQRDMIKERMNKGQKKVNIYNKF